MRRRHFLSLAASLPLAGALPKLAPRPERVAGAPSRILSSVKWGMVGIDAPVIEKFALLKRLGFDGVELVSPLGDLDPSTLRAASRAADLPIHGVVDMVHWRADHRLSSPDPEARARGVKALAQAVRDAADLGGDSVLLVPGVVADPETENHDQVWKRSQEAVHEVLPLAARRGVRILVENVWNGFCEDPESLARYLDGFGSPWVGSYFDLGNGLKFAPAERWLEVLGPRVVKLDVKDWGQEGGFGRIGDGDARWDAIREVLEAGRFTGWSTAEVRGGGEERLREILDRMRRHLIGT